jgi:hypothetical protein
MESTVNVGHTNRQLTRQEVMLFTENAIFLWEQPVRLG